MRLTAILLSLVLCLAPAACEAPDGGSDVAEPDVGELDVTEPAEDGGHDDLWECVPDCSGRTCGTDPVCGTSCGVCPGGCMCSADGHCYCSPLESECGDRECGPDPGRPGYYCGDLDGECPEGKQCNVDGMCYVP